MSKITLNYNCKRNTISKYVYGHFAEHIGGVIYDGLYVGEDSDIPNIKGFRKDIIDLLKDMYIPVLRWPGGCFVENYDWRDGIGDPAKRPVRVNFWHPNDGKLESNRVGTHEFMDLCEVLETEPYFAVNCTETTVLESRNWVEYCVFGGDTTLTRERKANGHEEPFGIRFWGLGNECWGDGGRMTGDYYSSIYKNYASSIHRVAPEGYFIACGPNENDKEWTETFFKGAYSGWLPHLNGFAMHYYTRGGGDCIDFNEEEWYRHLYNGLKMEPYVLEQRAIMDRYDPERHVDLIVDEWGSWHPDGSGPSKGGNLFEQQNTIRDAVLAAATLNIFNNHCDIVKMANIAQVVNNLQSLFLTVGKELIVTPTYYVFRMMRDNQNADLVECKVESEKIGVCKIEKISKINCSVSEKGGFTTVNLVNTHYSEGEHIEIDLGGRKVNGEISVVTLAGDPHDYN
ncbi:MAG: alpha-N-arabinofuranosidase, partial [Clostridia bacterium]|nr:alpha-N-arabinofuranosidase [Clostridia bacterium]